MPFPFLIVGSLVGSAIDSVKGNLNDKEQQNDLNSYIKAQNEYQGQLIEEEKARQKRNIEYLKYFGAGFVFLIIIIIINKKL